MSETAIEVSLKRSLNRIYNQRTPDCIKPVFILRINTFFLK
jgi:hypothetical protein